MLREGRHLERGGGFTSRQTKKNEMAAFLQLEGKKGARFVLSRRNLVGVTALPERPCRCLLDEETEDAQMIEKKNASGCRRENSELQTEWRLRRLSGKGGTHAS